ncbi:MAG: hypothetical protein KDA91_03555 [Planctomycetaceae bacterium]|nr:hypothetical protein [Planctomycetaceae bacterium]
MTTEATISPSAVQLAEKERSARLRAERYLEGKSLALNMAKEELREQHEALKQAQSALLHSEKMASIGQLAAGVAHEINNPIGFVTSNLCTLTEYVSVFKDLLNHYRQLEDAVDSGNLDAARELLPSIQGIRETEDLGYISDDAGDLLNESKDGLERVAEIVRNLKSFVRLGESGEQTADIHEGLESTLKVVWNELKYKCEVRKQFGDVPRILCYASELNQVFMNLFTNAAQAITEKGTILIETFTEGDEVVVQISDDGCGIPEENVGQLFNPFFTTKPVGSGTGLGLSVSWGIIQKHNGTIEVQSKVGLGTTFTIRLPIRRAT